MKEKDYNKIMKKKIVLFILEVLVIGISVTLFLNRDELLLKAKGFSNEQIIHIQTLSKEEKEYFVENINLHGLLVMEDFAEANFSQYVQLLKNEDVSLKEAVYLVNQFGTIDYELNSETIPFLLMDNVQVIKLGRYLDYQRVNPKIDLKTVVLMVNQDIDLEIMEFSPIILDILGSNQFKKDNLARYIHYLQSNPMDVEEGLRNVNANLDRPYYTGIQKTNLEDGYLMICNKYYSLEVDYVPANIVAVEEKYGYTNQSMELTAYNAFKQMADAAMADGLKLYITSGYRSYDKQNNIYNRYVSNDGQANADTYSARPGHSEHQTGLAVDIVTGPGGSLSGFRGTPQAKWLEENADQYGFILRYGKVEEERTGYIYEPWHYRYVGIDVAKEVKELGITFDEYYELYVK